jgi:hypothetical protein
MKGQAMELDQTKRRALYDNPTGRLQRDAEHVRQAESKRLQPMRDRHRKEKDEMQSRHRSASEKLRYEQQVERDYWAPIDRSGRPRRVYAT